MSANAKQTLSTRGYVRKSSWFARLLRDQRGATNTLAICFVTLSTIGIYQAVDKKAKPVIKDVIVKARDLINGEKAGNQSTGGGTGPQTVPPPPQPVEPT
jgi:hypothetical protein